MKRLVLMLFVLTIAASGVVLLARPGVEASPDTITVTSTADSGPGTLRQALLDAQSGDTITFDTAVFPPGSPATITLSSALPTISAGNVTVDGSSAGVIVDGVSGAFDCFDITSSGNAVKGLEIYRCQDGIRIGSGASSNIIGGSTANERNVISGNTSVGVRIRGSGTDSNIVKGNYIGTNAAGDGAMGNIAGVFIEDCQGNTIGGIAEGERNVISANSMGVLIEHADNNIVRGNYIGLDANGAVPLANDSRGVYVYDGAGNIVGGETDDERNVISGGDVAAVWITGGSNGNQVKGNYIGTNAAGNTAVGSTGRGVLIDYGAHENSVGGSTGGERNVISGNGQMGVGVLGSGSTGNVVSGNYIGTDATGTAPLGNLRGVSIAQGAQDNMVGGTGVGDGNLIAFNTHEGVKVAGASTLRNTIRGNSVHSNGDLGIENASGGNTELAAPVIDGLGGSVYGHTDPKCYPCTVEVFSDNEDEGRIYYGSTMTNDDATGTWIYSGPLARANMTATITDAAGNTSEFSEPFPFPVGGLAQLADLPHSPGDIMVAVAGLAAPALIILILTASYARRRLS